MNKFFVWLGSILGTVLLIALIGVVIYNNSPEFKNWVDGVINKTNTPNEDENKDNTETDTNAKITFENNQLIVVIS